MAEPQLMTPVALGAVLPVTSTMCWFFSVDLLVTNRISPIATWKSRLVLTRTSKPDAC